MSGTCETMKVKHKLSKTVMVINVEDFDKEIYELPKAEKAEKTTDSEFTKLMEGKV